MAEGWRVLRDGVHEAWVRNARFELFVWVRPSGYEHVQLCAGEDLLEWRPGFAASTGTITVRDERVGLAGLREGNLHFDRRPSPERIERLKKALSLSTLEGPLAELARRLLENEPPGATGPLIDAVSELPVLGAA